MIPRPRLRASLLRLAPIVVIVLAWLAFFWRILTPVEADRLTFQQGDFTLQFLAYRQMAYRQFATGHFPAYEECLYSGYPFQADPQSQVLYPPVLGLMLLGRAVGWAEYPLRALEWEVMGHVLLAALGMYVFLRGLRLRAIPAVFGALAFAFGGFMTGYAMLQTAILETAAWLPLILWAAHRLSIPAPTSPLAPTPAYAGERGALLPPPRSGGGLGWGPKAALLAFLAAVAYTAGHPQSLLFAVYTSAVAYAYWAAKHRLGWKAALGRGALAVALTLGLAAPQLLPSLSFMLASTRATLPFDKAGGGFALQDIALFTLTGVINVWQPLYAGVITLVLAGVAIAARRFTQPRHDTWLWLGIGAGALALGFGANALGFDLAYLLAPGYRQFQSQERHALVVGFALSTLGAIGLQALLVPLRRRARLRLRRTGGWLAVSAGAAFALLVASQVTVRLSEPRPESGSIMNSLAMIAIALLAAAGLFAWRARLGRTPRWAWGAAVLALLAFDVITVNRHTATQATAEPFPSLALTEPIQAQGDAGFFRINNHYGLPLNRACVDGRFEIGGGSPIVLRDYQTFLNRAPEGVYSRLLNVRYTVTWRGGMGTQNGETIPAQKLATAQVQGIDANLFRLDWPEPGLLPAWVASKVTVADGEDELYRRMNAGDFDPYQEAVIYARDAGRASAASSGSAGVEGRSTGYIKAAANTSGPALLVVSEAYHWNWIALVNDEEVNPVVVDGALLGVPLPSGPSAVEFSYRPVDAYAGLAIAGATLAATIALLAWSRRQARRR